MEKDRVTTEVTWQCDCCGCVLGQHTFDWERTDGLSKTDGIGLEKIRAVYATRLVTFANGATFQTCSKCHEALSAVAIAAPQTDEVPY